VGSQGSVVSLAVGPEAVDDGVVVEVVAGGITALIPV
jgi:hypothetical protein